MTTAAGTIRFILGDQYADSADINGTESECHFEGGWADPEIMKVLLLGRAQTVGDAIVCRLLCRLYIKSMDLEEWLLSLTDRQVEDLQHKEAIEMAREVRAGNPRHNWRY